MEGIAKQSQEEGEELLILLEKIHVVAVVGSLVTVVCPIPYGRYSNSLRLTGWTVSAQHVFPTLSLTWVFPFLMFIFTPSRMLSNFPNILAILLVLIHYVYRTLIYPHKYLQKASRWPIEPAIFCFCACSLNGFIQAFHLTNVYKVDSLGIISVAGILLYTIGLLINITHDGILAELRKRKVEISVNSTTTVTHGRSNFEKNTQYLIPSGGLFDYISAANYFGEIVEWWGLAIFTGGFSQVMFATWTTVLLGIRGWQYHQYYKEAFGKAYPTNRKALIPFIL